MSNNMTIRTSVDIDKSATDAWKVFGEGFGNWAEWAPGIDSSTLEGPLAEGVIRVNETASLGTVRQVLARFDSPNRALGYEVDESLPPFLHSMRNDWVIEELGANRCRLVGDALFVLKDEAVPMRDKLEGKMGMVLEAFALAFRDGIQEPQ